jgi:TrmH family RNA methyltransferase
MISNKQVKLITSLQVKKYRHEYNKFLAEGEKIADVILKSSYKIDAVYATKEWLSNHKPKNNIQYIEVSEKELEKLSGLKTPQNVIVVADIPELEFYAHSLKNNLSLVFDEIKDPGNFGSIIRIADWFGIKNIICSPDSVELYNPKVIQATMGSFCNVNVHYYPLKDLFEMNKHELHLPVFGTMLDGENIHQTKLNNAALILFGNESKGIKPDYLPYLTQKIKIPTYNKDSQKAESLNIAIATGIVCAEFRRISNKT